MRKRDTEEVKIMNNDEVIESSRSKKRKIVDKFGHATKKKKLEICIPKIRKDKNFRVITIFFY